jgi:hypothetical protein
MSDIKKDIVEEIDMLIGYNLKYRVSKSLEDIINKNNVSTLYPHEIELSMHYNKNEFLLDILVSYSISICKTAYIDLYYKKKGVEEERKIIYYKDGKRNKEINIKNSDIPPDKYIIPIEETHEYVDVSSFEDVISRIKEIIHNYNVQSLNIYNYRINYVYWRRFKLSGLTRNI